VSAELLLVGSIPMDTAEEVFDVFGPRLGEWLAYLPDGEVGDRSYWIDGLAHHVFNGHPELETIRWPSPDEDGVENWKPRGIHDQFRFRVRPGVERVRFGDPGWRLGYARDAVNAYAIFRHLKRDGVIPEHVRFQVCVPLTHSAIGGFFEDPADRERVAPGLTTALAAEVANIARHIPAEELAIQWDLALENRDVERALTEGGEAAGQAEAARVCRFAEEVCSAVPREVAIGYHSCFGTLDGWPTRQPGSLHGTVRLLNAAVRASGRPVDFVHFPTGASVQEEYFEPLRKLDVGGARIYFGAIHHISGPGGLARQVEIASRLLDDFGLAAPCGFGRAPERPGGLLTDEGDLPDDVIETIVADHRAAVALLGEGARHA
jgi:hypothetical protein